MNDDTSPLPPLRELFADASARAVWAAITALPAGLQHEILKALQRLLALPTRLDSHGTRVAHAVSCLREVADVLGHSPTSFEYRQVRAERPQLNLPADGTLQGWLGGTWNDALRQARLDTVPGGDVLVQEHGAAIESEAILEALRECAKELETIPTLHQYLSWVRRPDVKARPGRRPASQPPFTRAYGGYIDALKASGLVESEALANMPRSTRVRLGSYFITDETIAEALRTVAQRLGRPPRLREYVVEREKLITESVENGDVRSLASPSLIQRRYGTWDAALVAAGLEPLGGRATYNIKGARGGRKGPMISDGEIIEVLREAYAALGDPLTANAFKSWRVEQQQRDKQERRFRRLPSIDVVRTRFGWSKAIEIARGNDIDEDDDNAAGAVVAA
jgi:hypothetical protein